MGRAANRKWARRLTQFRKARVVEQLRLIKLFGRHRKFQAAA